MDELSEHQEAMLKAATDKNPEFGFYVMQLRSISARVDRCYYGLIVIAWLLVAILGAILWRVW